MLLLLGLVWYYVSGPSDWGKPAFSTTDSGKGEELWAWVQTLDETDPAYDGGTPKPVDWAARRDKVRDTFMVSWDSYEKYAWGMFPGDPLAFAGPFAKQVYRPALLIFTG